MRSLLKSKIHFLTLLFIPFIIFTNRFAYANLEIAFIELRNSKKEALIFDQNSTFSHIAIKVNSKNGVKKWLHVHPYHGVILEEKISYGEVAEVWTTNNSIVPSYQQIKGFLGLPFDHLYRWNSSGTYCSKLIATILGLQPKPMSFSSDYWQNHPDIESIKKSNSINPVGLSPADIYEVLPSLGFYKNSYKQTTCEKTLI